MKGTPSQTLVMIMARKFMVGSLSHCCGGMPKRPRTWFTAPNWKLYSVRQICSEMKTGMAQGRMSSAR